MATQLKEETLQDILAMTEPARTERLHEWVEEESLEYGDTILIRPVAGAGIQIPHKGGTMNFPPKGKRVSRRRAISLIRDWGPNGKYIGTDQETGMTKQKFTLLQDDERAKWSKTKFNFNENYLIHVPDGAEEEETEENG